VFRPDDKLGQGILQITPMCKSDPFNYFVEGSFRTDVQPGLSYKDHLDAYQTEYVDNGKTRHGVGGRGRVMNVLGLNLLNAIGTFVDAGILPVSDDLFLYHPDAYHVVAPDYNPADDGYLFSNRNWKSGLLQNYFSSSRRHIRRIGPDGRYILKSGKSDESYRFDAERMLRDLRRQKQEKQVK